VEDDPTVVDSVIAKAVDVDIVVVTAEVVALVVNGVDVDVDAVVAVVVVERSFLFRSRFLRQFRFLQFDNLSSLVHAVVVVVVVEGAAVAVDGDSKLSK